VVDLDPIDLVIFCCWQGVWSPLLAAMLYVTCKHTYSIREARGLTEDLIRIPVGIKDVNWMISLWILPMHLELDLFNDHEICLVRISSFQLGSLWIVDWSKGLSWQVIFFCYILNLKENNYSDKLCSYFHEGNGHAYFESLHNLFCSTLSKDFFSPICYEWW